MQRESFEELDGVVWLVQVLHVTGAVGFDWPLIHFFVLLLNVSIIFWKLITL